MWQDPGLPWVPSWQSADCGNETQGWGCLWGWDTVTWARTWGFSLLIISTGKEAALSPRPDCPYPIPGGNPRSHWKVYWVLKPIEKCACAAWCGGTSSPMLAWTVIAGLQGQYIGLGNCNPRNFIPDRKNHVSCHVGLAQQGALFLVSGTKLLRCYSCIYINVCQGPKLLSDFPSPKKLIQTNYTCYMYMVTKKLYILPHSLYIIFGFVSKHFRVGVIQHCVFAKCLAQQGSNHSCSYLASFFLSCSQMREVSSWVTCCK